MRHKFFGAIAAAALTVGITPNALAVPVELIVGTNTDSTFSYSLKHSADSSTRKLINQADFNQTVSGTFYFDPFRFLGPSCTALSCAPNDFLVHEDEGHFAFWRNDTSDWRGSPSNEPAGLRINIADSIKVVPIPAPIWLSGTAFLALLGIGRFTGGPSVA